MKSKRRLVTFLFFIAIAAVCILLPKALSNKEKIESIEISYTNFLQKIQDNEFQTVEIKKGSTRAEAISINDKTKVEQIYLTDVPNQEAFIDFVQSRIEKGYKAPEITIMDDSSGFDLYNLFSIAYFVLIIMMFISLFKRAKNLGKNMPSFMSPFNTDINYIDKMAKSNVKFSDVAGLDEEKQELVEIVDFLKNPEKYEKIGAKIPKGVLLSGAPGTGKTLLAKAVAGEAEVSYLAISGSEFVEKYVGVGASRIRGLFKEARKNAPCIIFIDEIDAVGSKREDGGNSEHNQTLEQLLTELDGFEDRRDIVILGATNRLSSLDPALTRPGRFDRKINVNLPDVKGREEILKIHAKGKLFGEEIDFKNIAHNTSGYSGAELANLLNEAALIAARRGHEAIYREDIDEALKKITVGLEKAGRIVPEKERKITAVHEAGHAIVAHLLDSQEKVKEISIIPRGDAGGYTWQNREEEKLYMGKRDFQDKLKVLLAGRVAESIELTDISSGASNDLEVATKIAKEMIIRYGMDNEIGPISLNGFSDSEVGLLGEEKIKDIGIKIAETLKEAERKAKDLLMRNQQILKAVADELLDKETISGEELNDIFGKYLKK